MKKRCKIRLSAFLAGAFLVVAGLWADSRISLASSRRDLEYAYRRALNDLTDYVSGMGSVLEKAPYVSTASMQNTVSAKLLEQSGGAKAALGALPLSQEKADRISRFLSQTGDYALSLNRKAAAGGGLDGSDLENLALLEDYAEKLSGALRNAQARLDAEGASIGRTGSALSNVEELEALPVLDDDFDEVAQAFSQFPSLLYDGPFSDHIQRREPLFLQGKREWSKDEAAGKAADFLRCSPEDLSYLGEGGGQLPVFSFSQGDSHVNLTKLGGEIAYFKKSGAVTASNLSYEDALEKASQTLEELGVGPFRESYYVLNDNLCTINFSAVQKIEGPSGEELEAVCYPDLIKVTIELDRGGMVEYDAAGYLMNHRERDLPAPVLSQEEAARNLSPLLTVISSAPALIPTPGLDEVLCWEFSCVSQDGKRLLAYLNAETGLEEQLFLLREDDHGILVN